MGPVARKLILGDGDQICSIQPAKLQRLAKLRLLMLHVASQAMVRSRLVKKGYNQTVGVCRLGLHTKKIRASRDKAQIICTSNSFYVIQWIMSCHK